MIIFVEEIEMLISGISILFTMIEKLLTKSSSKEIFARKSFINFIFLIIKSATRKSFRIAAKRLK